MDFEVARLQVEIMKVRAIENSMANGHKEETINSADGRNITEITSSNAHICLLLLLLLSEMRVFCLFDVFIKLVSTNQHISTFCSKPI